MALPQTDRRKHPRIAAGDLPILLGEDLKTPLRIRDLSRAGVAFYSEIIDMARFKTLDHLKSYVGLVPSVRSSGDTEHVWGLTFRRNRFLKYVIIEAAWVAIRKDPALLACYNKLISRMKAQSAIIRIAKKLLGRIRYVWLNNVPYKTCVA